MADLRGFARGLNAGSAAIARGFNASNASRQNDILQQRTDLFTAQGQQQATSNALADLQGVLAEGWKSINESREANGQPLLTKDEFTSLYAKQIEQGNILAEQNAKAGGGLSPDLWQAQLDRIAMQPTASQLAARAARAEATGEVAGAATVAPFVGDEAARMRIGGVEQAHDAKMDEAQLAVSRRNAAINAMNATTARINSQDVINFIVPDENGNPKWAGVRTTDPNASAQIDDILKSGGFQADASAAAANASDLDLGKSAYKDFVRIQSSALDAVDLAERLDEQLADGDVMTSFAGGVVSLVTGLAGNAQQLARSMGGTAYEADTGAVIPESDLLKQSKYAFDNFGAEASKSAAFRTNILNFAYASLRSNDPTGKVSDKDLQAKLNSLAANSGNKEAIRAAIAETNRGTKRSFNNYYSSFAAMSPGQKLPPIPDRLKLDSAPKTAQQPSAATGQGIDAVLPLIAKIAAGKPVSEDEFNALTPEQRTLLKQKVNELGLRSGATE